MIAPRRSGGVPWGAAAVCIATVLAVPVLAVLSSLAFPEGEVWLHLLRTQLLELVVNTVLLLAGVGAGTLVVGTGLAWLIVHHRFPGRAVLEWALILPLAVPAYVLGFAFLGLFDFAGPVQSAFRGWLGPGSQAARAALLLGCSPDDDAGLLPLRLPACARSLPGPGHGPSGDGADPRPLPLAGIPGRDPADGTAVTGSGCGPAR